MSVALSPTTTPDSVRRAADGAGLGSFVAPLTRRQVRPVRLAVIGLGLLGFAAYSWTTHQVDPGSTAGLLLIVTGLTGLVVLALALIGMVPMPGRVYLYEDGYVHQHGQDIDVVLYNADTDGELLRIRARTVLFTQPA